MMMMMMMTTMHRRLFLLKLIGILVVILSCSNLVIGIQQDIEPTLKEYFAANNIHKNIPRLILKDEVDIGKATFKASTGEYDGKPVFVKCSRDKKSYEMEREVFDYLNQKRREDTKRRDIWDAELVVRQIGEFTLNSGGFYCMVLSSLRESYDLLTYVALTPREARIPSLYNIIVKTTRALAYLHRNGVMHSDIKPDNILTNERGEVLLIDFDRSIIFGKDLTVRPGGGTAGYVPIDYFNLPYNNQRWKERNFYAYDAWEFGSTIYSLLMDMPPYGYDRSGEIPRMYNIQEAAKELLSLMNFKKHTCPSLDFPTNTLNSEEKRLAKRLIKWTTKLIAIDPLERLTPIGMLAKL